LDKKEAGYYNLLAKERAKIVLDFCSKAIFETPDGY